MNDQDTKSNRIDERAKHFLSLSREYDELRKEKHEACLVKLEKPFIRGFERFFVLTDQAQRRSDSDDLTLALTFFQKHEYCRKGWFRNEWIPGKRWAKGEVGEHHLHSPRLASLIKKSFPQNLYRYVESRTTDLQERLPPTHQLKSHQWSERLTFRLPHLLVSRYQPRIVTHLPLHDRELEARLDYLEEVMWGKDDRGALSKALHFRRWRRDGIPKAELASRENFRQQLDEVGKETFIQNESAIMPRFFCAYPESLAA